MGKSSFPPRASSGRTVRFDLSTLSRATRRDLRGRVGELPYIESSRIRDNVLLAVVRTDSNKSRPTASLEEAEREMRLLKAEIILVHRGLGVSGLLRSTRPRVAVFA